MSFFVAAPAHAAPNYHLLGWLNTFVPGSGQLLLGNSLRGSAEALGEVGTFAWGYSLSKRSPLSLDGVPEELPRFRFGKRSIQADISRGVYADILQEVGIKAHMVNVFDAYRMGALNEKGELPERMESKSINALFMEPFNKDNLSNPWVYGSLAAVFAITVLDYVTIINGGVPPAGRIGAYSNNLYAFNYGFWQPFGSGAPEEMFFRGFVQNELYDAVPSPYFAIPVTASLFALAHEPGAGRYSAAVAGTYLGFLAHHHNGRLGPGITVHFWSVVLLGIETVLLNQQAQRTTPPAALSYQFNF